MNTHGISSDRPIKLFVRVKERIIPEKCTFKVTPTVLEITLMKDNPNSLKWGRLEPNEYTEPRPSIQQTPPTSPNTTDPPAVNPNKAIPLPPPPPPPPPVSTNRQVSLCNQSNIIISSISVR